MKVWIVHEDYCEGHGEGYGSFLAVCATQELAEDEIEQYRNKYPDRHVYACGPGDDPRYDGYEISIWEEGVIDVATGPAVQDKT